MLWEEATLSRHWGSSATPSCCFCVQLSPHSSAEEEEEDFWGGALDLPMFCSFHTVLDMLVAMTEVPVSRYWGLKVATLCLGSVFLFSAVFPISWDKGPLWIWSYQAASAPCMTLLFSCMLVLDYNLLHFLVLTVSDCWKRMKRLRTVWGMNIYFYYFFPSPPI